MDLQTAIGLTASTLTTLASIPQLIKIIKSHKAENISMIWVTILFTGLCGWIYYGFLKQDYIILISNGVGALINAAIGIFSSIYKNKKQTR